MFITISAAARILGVCTKTLRRWNTSGKLIPQRTSGNHRRYDLTAVSLFYEQNGYHPASSTKSGIAAVYCRVSSGKQKEDLQRQKHYLQEKAMHDGYIVKTYADIGSGLNDKRPALLRLLRDAMRSSFDVIYITYLDRLARFGTRPLLEILSGNNIRIRIMHQKHSSDPHRILMEDMIALVTSFAGKLHRMRRGKNQVK